MKKLLVLAMVLGLLMVEEARADGAWVLWEKNDLEGYQTDTDPKTPYTWGTNPAKKHYYNFPGEYKMNEAFPIIIYVERN